MKWRQLTEQEAATLPEARLSGSLLFAVIVAACLFVVAIAGAILAFDRLREIGPRYMAAVAFIAVWSPVFVIMTLLRGRCTPAVASIGLAIWIAYRLCVVLANGPVAHWPLLIDVLGQALLAAGFCGYMASALRPNAYYRRRFPTL